MAEQTLGALPPSELAGTSDSQSGAPCLHVPVYTCEPARAPQGVTMTQLHQASGYLCGCVCGHSPEYRLLFPGCCDSTAHGDPGAHRPAVSFQLPPSQIDSVGCKYSLTKRAWNTVKPDDLGRPQSSNSSYPSAVAMEPYLNQRMLPQHGEPRR